MTTEDLLAAATNIKECCHPESDEAILADFVIAQLTAKGEESELPVDEAWLLSVGFTNDDGSLCLRDDERWSRCEFDSQRKVWAMMPFVFFTTRRQVRALLMALNITRSDPQSNS